MFGGLFACLGDLLFWGGFDLFFVCGGFFGLFVGFFLGGSCFVLVFPLSNLISSYGKKTVKHNVGLKQQNKTQHRCCYEIITSRV